MYEADVVDLNSFENSTDVRYKELIEKTLSNNDKSEDYVIQNELLYKRVKRNDGNVVYRIYIPSDRVAQALQECHDERTAAHGGFFKTFHRVKQYYYWANMESDVRAYVRDCLVCKASKL